MKYIIIENKIVKQVQLDDKYNLSETEIMVEVPNNTNVVCGQTYDKKTNTFTTPKIAKTKEQLIEDIDNATKQKIFSKYSDNKQRTLLMKAMSGDTTEFQEMTTFVNQCLAEGQAKKDKLQ